MIDWDELYARALAMDTWQRHELDTLRELMRLAEGSGKRVTVLEVRRLRISLHEALRTEITPGFPFDLISVYTFHHASPVRSLLAAESPGVVDERDVVCLTHPQDLLCPAHPPVSLQDRAPCGFAHPECRRVRAREVAPCGLARQDCRARVAVRCPTHGYACAWRGEGDCGFGFSVKIELCGCPLGRLPWGQHRGPLPVLHVRSCPLYKRDARDVLLTPPAPRPAPQVAPVIELRPRQKYDPKRVLEGQVRLLPK